MPKPLVVLICTGLGRLNRGFEMYISSLGEKINNHSDYKSKVQVWCGGRYQSALTKVYTIPSINRKSWLIRRFISPGNAFLIEQFSFALGMIPRLLGKRPSVLYLGEYRLYCYLYKIRRLLGLQYSLVLYTGGQAVPGLFDSQKDFIHHVTDVYLPECRHLPQNRQFLLPHFVDTHFEYCETLSQNIRSQSRGKKIVLSVGLLDIQIKRMDYLVKSLLPLREKVFPILLGETNDETPAIRKILEKKFGSTGYIMKKVERNELGTWYRTADVFVLCSPRESFGLAMVEALYHGLPVFCDNFPEARFVLKDNARYIDMKKPEALTNALRQWLEQEYPAEVKQQRKNFVESQYSWFALRDQYSNMFNRFTESYA